MFSYIYFSFQICISRHFQKKESSNFSPRVRTYPFSMQQLSHRENRWQRGPIVELINLQRRYIPIFEPFWPALRPYLHNFCIPWNQRWDQPIESHPMRSAPMTRFDAIIENTEYTERGLHKKKTIQRGKKKRKQRRETQRRDYTKGRRDTHREMRRGIWLLKKYSSLIAECIQYTRDIADALQNNISFTTKNRRFQNM